MSLSNIRPQDNSYHENRITQLFFISATAVTIVIAAWSLAPDWNFIQLNRQTPQTAAKYFNELHRGSKQDDVEKWLSANGLKIECSKPYHGRYQTNFIRLKTNPETILRIEFKKGVFIGSDSLPYKGACPPHLEDVVSTYSQTNN